MKKKMWMTMMLMGYFVSVHAQWTLTPEIGMTAVKRSMWGGPRSWRPGVKVGAGVEYRFQPDFFSLKSGLYYTQRGYSENRAYMSMGGESAGSAYMAWGQITTHYLQLPVMAGFSWALSEDCRLQLAVGPYVAWRVGENWSWGGMMASSDNQPYPNSPFAGKRAFDWGASASVGVEVKRLVVTAGYDLSLGKEYPKMAAKANYHTMSLSVGYKFRLGR